MLKWGLEVKFIWNYRWHLCGCQINGQCRRDRPRRRPDRCCPVEWKHPKRNPDEAQNVTTFFCYNKELKLTKMTKDGYFQVKKWNLKATTYVLVSWMRTFLSALPLKMRRLSGEKAKKQRRFRVSSPLQSSSIRFGCGRWTTIGRFCLVLQKPKWSHRQRIPLNK